MDLWTQLARAFTDGPMAQDATYKPADGGPHKSIRVLVGASQVERERTQKAEYASIHVAVDDVPEPQLGDVIAVGDKEWIYYPSPEVQILQKQNGGLIELRCSRNSRPMLRRAG